MILNGEYYLVTTDLYFLAPDGEQYKSAWGKCKVIEAKEMFGFVPLKPSTNWYLECGEGENSIIVAGCQIHYAVRCAVRPKLLEGTYVDEVTKINMAINRIYFTE